MNAGGGTASAASKAKPAIPGDEESLSFGEGNGGLCIRVGFLLVSLVTFAAILASMSQCRFLTYEPRSPPPGTIDLRPLNFTVADIGIYRYDPNLEGCRDIPDDVDIDGSFKAVRVGAAFSIICAVTAISMVLVELTFCRFPCSQTLTCLFFFCAAVFQSLTFLMFNIDLCSPNYEDGPYACKPSAGTWFATFAVVFLIVLGMVVYCIPQPVPIVYRVQKANSGATTDRCCAFLGRKKASDDNEEEAGDEAMDMEEPQEYMQDDEEAAHDDNKAREINVYVAKRSSASRHSTATAPPPQSAAQEVVVEDAVEHKLREQKAHLEITTALVQIRRDKHEEIERQLALLTTYKDALPDEVYAERMQALMLSLPDPSTYDAYTSTTILNDLPAVDSSKGDKDLDANEDDGEDRLNLVQLEEFPGQNEPQEVEEEVGQSKKKRMGGKLVSTVKSTVSSVKSKVSFGGKKSTSSDADVEPTTGTTAVHAKELGGGTIGGSFHAAAAASDSVPDDETKDD